MRHMPDLHGIGEMTAARIGVTDKDPADVGNGGNQTLVGHHPVALIKRCIGLGAFIQLPPACLDTAIRPQGGGDRQLSAQFDLPAANHLLAQNRILTLAQRVQPNQSKPQNRIKPAFHKDGDNRATRPVKRLA